MKAEELMIGDWVIRRGVPEEPMRLYDMKVSAGIAYLDQDGRGVTEKFENIEPIPLTSEILEKNGFERIDGKGTDFLIKGFLYWSSFAKRIFLQGHPNQIDYIDVCECQYVHEFQHELKHCKIEKNIIL